MGRSRLIRALTILLLIAIVVSSVAAWIPRRYAKIESLAFSSDNSRILVTKLTAQDAQTPMKRYKKNVARIVSWIGVPDGKSLQVIHRDFKPGNCGPAHRLWWNGRVSTLREPSTDDVTMAEFGGGSITRQVGSKDSVVIPIDDHVSNLTFSKSGRFLAASDAWHVLVFDAATNTEFSRIVCRGAPFISASYTAFTDDESQLVVAGDNQLRAWDTAKAEVVATILNDSDIWITSMAIALDDTLIVCCDRWVRRYDLTGNVIATIMTGGQELCSVSGDGRRLALYGPHDLLIYDIDSNRVLLANHFENERITAASLSSDGELVAVGDNDGHITLIDISTGKQRWSADPPGR